MDRNITSKMLAIFRRRIALTNPKAGYHFLALARATRGDADILRDGSLDGAYVNRYAWEKARDVTWPMRRYAIDRWNAVNRLSA